MPFLGKSPTAGFASIVKDDLTPDGSTTAFTLSKNVANSNDIAVFVGNVRQEPTDAYSVSGTTLTMTAAPASGLNFYVLHIAGTVESSVIPADGTITTAKLNSSIDLSGKTVTYGLTDGDMPTGFLGNQAITTSGTNYNINADSGGAATTLTHLPNYDVTITPQRSGSKFLYLLYISSTGFANTSGSTAIYTRTFYSVAGGTDTATNSDCGVYGSSNTYTPHNVKTIVTPSYTLGQSITFKVKGYGQYSTAGQYAWIRVGGGMAAIVMEIPQ